MALCSNPEKMRNSDVRNKVILTATKGHAYDLESVICAMEKLGLRYAGIAGPEGRFLLLAAKDKISGRLANNIRRTALFYGITGVEFIKNSPATPKVHAAKPTRRRQLCP